MRCRIRPGETDFAALTPKGEEISSQFACHSDEGASPDRRWSGSDPPKCSSGLLREVPGFKVALDEPDDQHFFIIRTVEYTDPSTFWKAARRPPERVVFQFFGPWLLEAENLTTLWIYSGHHMPNGTVLTRAVDALKDQQLRMTIGGR